MWTEYDGVYVIGTNNKKRDSEIRENLTASGIRDYVTVVGEKASAPMEKKESLMDILSYRGADPLAKVISDTHFNVVEQAYLDGKNQILVLEDDARFDLPIDSAKILRMHEWMRTNDWDMFYYGHVPWPIVFTIPQTLDVTRVFTPLTSHCYAVSRKGMVCLLQHKERRDVCIDKLFSELPLNKFAALPSISFQSEPPKLYKQTGVPLSFRTTSRIIEGLAILIPVIVICIIAWIIVRQIRKRINEQTATKQAQVVSN